MEFNISDEKISQLVEKEIARYVRDRIERVMNDGKAYWFSQQNIERLTQAIVYDKIRMTIIEDTIKSLDKDELTKKISDEIATRITNLLNEL